MHVSKQFILDESSVRPQFSSRLEEPRRIEEVDILET